MSDIVSTERLHELDPGPGSICGTCGHWAIRHGPGGCGGVLPRDEPICRFGDDDGHRCTVFQWGDRTYYRPWLPAPAGLTKEGSNA